MAGLASRTITLDASPVRPSDIMTDPLQLIALHAAADLPCQTTGLALNDLPALSLLDQLSDFVCVKDPQGRLVFCNQTICRVVGVRDASELVGKTDFDLVDEAAARRLRDLDRQVLATGEPVEKYEERFQLASGSTWLSISKAALRNACDEIIGIVEVSRDITERKRQEDLRHGHARLLEMIARGQPLAEVLEALTKLAEEQLDDVRAAIMMLREDGRLTSVARPSLPDAYVALIVGLDVGPACGSCGTAVWRQAPVIVSDVQVDPLWADYRELGPRFGFRACWSTPIIGAGNRVLGTFALYSPTKREPSELELELITMATDLAGIAIEREMSERRIRHMAHHDPLTGLPNRTLFWERFGRAVEEARLDGRKLAVVYVDLDNFKQINDTLGHAAGDEVLKTLGARMQDFVGPDDLLVRLGGDEFALVLGAPSPDEGSTVAVLDELRSRISAPIALADQEVVATCSIGTAFFPADGREPDDLMASADRAMYEAKEQGRDCVSICA